MRYDIVIVGDGFAGYTAARRTTAGGLKTVSSEKKAIGSVCLNKGCIPTRTLLYSIKLWNTMKGVTKYGVIVPDVPALDMGKIIDRRGKVVKKLTGGVRITAGSYGVAIMEKKAVIADEENGMFRIVMGGETYEVIYLPVCVGSDMVILPVSGLPDMDYWTSKGAFESKEPPRSLIIIGDSVIGIGFVSFFDNTETKVSVVEMMPGILGVMDKETVDMLRSECSKRNVSFHLGTGVTVVPHEGVAVEKSNRASLIEAGEALVSVGRKTNLGQVGLNKLNVELLRNGMKVDKHMQTSHPRVYTYGDIASRSILAHTAIREGEVAVNHILGVKDAMSCDCTPGVTYISPEVAGVERTEKELRALGIGYHIQRLSMAYSGHLVAKNEPDNELCKLVLDDGGRIIGYHLLDDPASEITMATDIAVRRGYTMEGLQESIFPHPTMGEILHETFLV